MTIMITTTITAVALLLVAICLFLTITMIKALSQRPQPQKVVINITINITHAQQKLSDHRDRVADMLLRAVREAEFSAAEKAATPLRPFPPVMSPQTREKMNERFDTLQKIVDQLEACGYDCIGGPLSHNLAFIKLKELAKEMPVITEGLKAISRERGKQIHKHGFTPKHDQRYTNDELRYAAIYLMSKDNTWWPDLSKEWKDKFDGKPYGEMLEAAGAFVAAELDRMKFKHKA